MDAWTTALNLISQLVSPAWNDLLQYIPLLLMGLIGVVVALLAWAWQRNLAVNRSRVPRPAPAGPMPEGLHLPGPSKWPFVVPIGLFLVFLSLVFAPSGMPFNLLLLTVGGAFAALGAVGWLMDARHEYDRMSDGEHGLVLVPETAGRPVSHEPPEGVHLPGPSAWPFLAPIGLFFVFLGLIFGPVLILGGLAMASIAALGWYLDAGREYGQVEAGHPAEPRTRDPEQAFPKRLGPVYVGVAAFTILFTLTPWLLSYLPKASDANAGPPPTSTPSLSASEATRFDQSLLVVVANQPFTLTFRNTQDGIPHNVGIYDTPAKAKQFFQGEDVVGPNTITYEVGPLAAGAYTFLCTIHPPMVGVLRVK